MNYELAKKLKYAGFPRDKCHGGIVDSGNLFQIGMYQGVDNGAFIEVPTLSELIEACGGEMFDIIKAPDGQWLCKGGEKYTAVVGSTPEEAVANLWLVLNKKDD